MLNNRQVNIWMVVIIILTLLGMIGIIFITLQIDPDSIFRKILPISFILLLYGLGGFEMFNIIDKRKSSIYNSFIKIKKWYITNLTLKGIDDVFNVEPFYDVLSIRKKIDPWDEEDWDEIDNFSENERIVRNYRNNHRYDYYMIS